MVIVSDDEDRFVLPAVETLLFFLHNKQNHESASEYFFLQYMGCTQAQYTVKMIRAIGLRGETVQKMKNRPLLSECSGITGQRYMLAKDLKQTYSQQFMVYCKNCGEKIEALQKAEPCRGYMISSI